MKALANSAFKAYYKKHYRDLQERIGKPFDAQNEVFLNLIEKGEKTEYGSEYNFNQISKYIDFQEQVPIVSYENLFPYINRMMHGQRDVLWPGRTQRFAKSSGTTQKKSKFIPISKENLLQCHIKGTWDTASMHYHFNPDSQIFRYKNMLMGGTLFPFSPYPKTTVGDISAHLIENIPWVGRPFHTPDFKTSLMSDWEEKIERMARIISKEDIACFGGVPTWIIVLFDRILEITGKDNLVDLWPNIECYMHGGVGFAPYIDKFKKYIPKDDFRYIEIYNATEGFFASRHHYDDDDMLLFVDNGIFYEFLPAQEWHSDDPKAIPLEDIELEKQYALVISTNSGLWRYMPGDTIMFTSKSPYKIKITGRITQYINAFGEEVIMENTDKALSTASRSHDVIVSEYTVAPRYFEDENRAGHEWLLEFEKEPDDLDAFNKTLDEELQKLNSDYESKRTRDLALGPPIIHKLPQDTFLRWMKKRGKYGGQHKVPRLANHRNYVEEILDLVSENR